jgi:hypothetical protein
VVLTGFAIALTLSFSIGVAVTFTVRMFMRAAAVGE